MAYYHNLMALLDALYTLKLHIYDRSNYTVDEKIDTPIAMYFIIPKK